MIQYFTEIAKLVAEKGFNFIVKSENFKSQCDALGEKIKRELKFNLEVLNEIIKINQEDTVDKKEKIKILFSLMKEKTFNEIDDAIIPIKRYFPKNINIPEDMDYQYYLVNVETLSDLIERIYFRIQIIKFHLENSKTNPDYEYLRKLFLIAIKEF